MGAVKLFDSRGKPLEGLTPRHAARRVVTVQSRDRISDAFDMEPADLGATMAEALGKGESAWEAYGKLIAAAEHYWLIDGRVHANFDKLLERIAGMDWQIVPSEHDPNGEADAEEIEKLFDNIPNLEDDLLSELADAILSGFAAVEPTAEMVGNELVVTGCRGIEQWALRPDASRTGEWEYRDENSNWLSVPAGKLITWERRHKGSVITGGLLWTVLWLALIKSYSLKDWVGFLETYGQPFRLGSYPPEVDENSEEFATLVRAVIDIATDAGAVIPQGMAIDFKEVAKGSTDAYERMIKRIDTYLDQLFLGGTLTQEAGDRGARSLGDVHDDQLNEKARSHARGLAGALSAWIQRLVGFLHGPRQGYPKFAFVNRNVREMAARLAVDEKLVGLGMTLRTEELYEEYGRGKPEDGDDVVGPATAAPKAAPPPPPKGQAPDDDDDDDGFDAEAADRRQFADTFVEGLRAEEDAQRKAFETPFIGELAAVYDRRAAAIGALVAKHGATGAIELLGDLADDFEDDFADALARPIIAFSLQAAQHVWLEGLEDSDAGDEFPAASFLAGQMIDSLCGGGARSHFAEPRKFHYVSLELPDGAIKSDWKKVTPKAAVAYWQKTTAVSASKFAELSATARRSAFSIARLENERVLAASRDAIGEALQDGLSEAETKKRIRQAFTDAGLTAPNPHHLRTIFRQNASTAYGAGRFATQTSPGVMRFLPWLQLVPRRDARPSHAALKNVCLPADSPAWKVLAPPLDWGCRCVARSRRRPPAGSITDAALVPMPSISATFENRAWQGLPGGDA
ncbi:MAG: DUF935 family protein [Candidatus Lernaella stagnicola]|nr:DUF935 family protein [Candidatus Lernaella stagnicola]